MERKAAFAIGQRVKVINSTTGGRRTIEGYATIRRIEEHGDDYVWADVEFEDEPGTNYRRCVLETEQDKVEA